MNKKVLSFVNKLEGYKTAIKSLHWDSDSLSQHELCDKIADTIAEFQDTVSEVEQSITGKLSKGELKPESYKVTSLKKFVEDVLDATNTFYKDIEDEGDTYTGMRSDCESFLSDMQRNLYLVNFTMKEDLKRSIAKKLNEGYRNEENIKTTFHGTKPSTEKGVLKRINDLTKNGQLNTRVFNGINDVLDFYRKILGNVGRLRCIDACAENNYIVKMETESGWNYYGLLRVKDVNEGQCKASITFSPHGDEPEVVEPNPEPEGMPIEDDRMYEIALKGSPRINESISAHDIFRQVKDEIFNLKNTGELEVPILPNDMYVPTSDDFLRAYFQDENELTVEYEGKSIKIPCSINANDEMMARCIMQGFAKIHLGKTNESIIRMTGDELHRMIKESVQKLIEGDRYSYNGNDYRQSIMNQYAPGIEREENYKENLKRFKEAFRKISMEYSVKGTLKGFLKFVKEVEEDTLYDRIWEKYGGEYEELADQYLQKITFEKKKRMGI